MKLDSESGVHKSMARKVSIEPNIKGAIIFEEYRRIFTDEPSFVSSTSVLGGP